MFSVEKELISENNPWSEDAFMSLIQIVESHHHRFLDPKAPRPPIWADIVQQMSLLGCKVDVNQCRHKWLQLKVFVHS